MKTCKILHIFILLRLRKIRVMIWALATHPTPHWNPEIADWFCRIFLCSISKYMSHKIYMSHPLSIMKNHFSSVLCVLFMPFKLLFIEDIANFYLPLFIWPKKKNIYFLFIFNFCVCFLFLFFTISFFLFLLDNIFAFRFIALPFPSIQFYGTLPSICNILYYYYYY